MIFYYFMRNVKYAYQSPTQETYHSPFLIYRLRPQVVKREETVKI